MCCYTTISQFENSVATVTNFSSFDLFWRCYLVRMDTVSNIVARLHEFVVIPGNAIRSLMNKAENRIEQLESELAKDRTPSATVV
jgi:hypothetical protein